MRVDVQKLDTVRCVGGEGPLWDDREQVLYFFDNVGQKLHCFDPATASSRTWDMPGVITAFALRSNGGGVLALPSGIHVIDLATGVLERLVPHPRPGVHGFNDGIVDRRGRFIIGASTPDHASKTKGEGGVLRLDADHGLTRLSDDIMVSNGPAFSPDDRTFYFADSVINTIYAYDYDIETGTLSNRRIFATTDDLGGLPDGMTVDADGRLWVAIYNGAKIAVFNPDGTLAREVPMPVRLVSSVMFGGKDLDRLFVTTIAHGDAEEDAGYCYVVDGLGVKGIAEPRFAG